MEVNLPYSAINFIDTSSEILMDLIDEEEELDDHTLEELEDLFTFNLTSVSKFVKEPKSKKRRFTEVKEDIQEKNQQTLKEIEKNLDSIQRYKEKAKEMIKSYTNKKFNSVLKITKQSEKGMMVDNHFKDIDDFYENYTDITKTQIKCLKEFTNIYLNFLEKEVKFSEAKIKKLNKETESIVSLNI